MRAGIRHESAGVVSVTACYLLPPELVLFENCGPSGNLSAYSVNVHSLDRRKEGKGSW